MHSIRRRAAPVLIGLATAVLVITAAILPFLTPQWVGFEQGRANATAWTGYTTAELRTATDAILGDLVFASGDFDVEVAGEPVLTARERGHMRDVRTVFTGLWLLAGASIVVLAIAAIRGDGARAWQAARRGALILAGSIAAIGVVALVAFDVLFELFHRVFFSSGSYTFDPASERLVQLFPFTFWQETAIVVGAVIVTLALAVAFAAGRFGRSAGERPVAALAADPVGR